MLPPQQETMKNRAAISLPGEVQHYTLGKRGASPSLFSVRFVVQLVLLVVRLSKIFVNAVSVLKYSGALTICPTPTQNIHKSQRTPTCLGTNSFNYKYTSIPPPLLLLLSLLFPLHPCARARSVAVKIRLSSDVC